MSRPACTCTHPHADHNGGCTRCECTKYQEPPRRTRGDGAFFQRADGKWTGRVEMPRGADGKRRIKRVISADRNVAIEKFKKLRSDVQDGRIAVTGNTTVAKWLTRWINDIHAPRIRPGVATDYRAVIANHIVPAIGPKRIDKLTPQHVRDMHTAIGPKRTAELAHVILQKALKDAVREGMIVRNVAELVDKPKYARENRSSLSVLTAKQVIAAAFASRDESDATRVAAAFLTGARRGELLGLEWGRVDLKGGAIDLSWQLQQLTQAHGCGQRTDGGWPCGRKLGAYCPQRRWELPPDFENRPCHRSLLWTRPKSAAGERWVPILPPLVDALRTLRDRPGPNPHGLVWHHDDGRPISPRDDYTMWQDVFRAAKIIGPKETLPPHVVRHTTATLLRAAGVDEQTRMEIVGHATADSQRIYAHADRERHLEAMGSLGELMS